MRVALDDLTAFDEVPYSPLTDAVDVLSESIFLKMLPVLLASARPYEENWDSDAVAGAVPARQGPSARESKSKRPRKQSIAESIASVGDVIGDIESPDDVCTFGDQESPFAHQLPHWMSGASAGDILTLRAVFRVNTMKAVMALLTSNHAFARRFVDAVLTGVDNDANTREVWMFKQFLRYVRFA